MLKEERDGEIDKTSTSHQWSDDIEDVLGKIRENCIMMSNYHKMRYYYFKGLLKYFRIPTIILSAANSVFSVGLQPYMAQETISLITCLIALFVGIINSVELFLAIQSTMEQELTTSKDFYILSIDIYKILLLHRNHRSIDGKTFLDEKYSIYCKLFEGSQLVNKEINDRLIPLLTIKNRSGSGSKKSRFKSLFSSASSASASCGALSLVPPSHSHLPSHSPSTYFMNANTNANINTNANMNTNANTNMNTHAVPSDETFPSASSFYINIIDE